MNSAYVTQEQTVCILREQEAHAKRVDPARKHVASQASIYNWKADFGWLFPKFWQGFTAQSAAAWTRATKHLGDRVQNGGCSAPDRCGRGG